MNYSRDTYRPRYVQVVIRTNNTYISSHILQLPVSEKPRFHVAPLSPSLNFCSIAQIFMICQLS